MSDSRDECRAIDFERKYSEYYGCDSDDDDCDEEERDTRVSDTRRRLGWNW